MQRSRWELIEWSLISQSLCMWPAPKMNNARKAEPQPNSDRSFARFSGICERHFGIEVIPLKELPRCAACLPEAWFPNHSWDLLLIHSLAFLCLGPPAYHCLQDPWLRHYFPPTALTSWSNATFASRPPGSTGHRLEAGLILAACRWIPCVGLVSIPPGVVSAENSHLSTALISQTWALPRTSLPPFLHTRFSPPTCHFLITSHSLLPEASQVNTAVVEPKTWQQRQKKKKQVLVGAIP